MTSINFDELYKAAETGVAKAAVPTGDYEIVVSRSDPYDGKMIYLTLNVLDGPLAGKDSDVNIYFPKEGDKRGTQVYFAKKMAGFMGFPDVKAALLAARNAPDDDSALSLIADTLKDKRVRASVKLIEEGQYEGTNELQETRRSATSPLPEAETVTATSSVPEVGAQPAPSDSSTVAF